MQRTSFLLTSCVLMGTFAFAESASAQTLTTVLNNGPSTNRIDLIFIGDGYTSSQVDDLYPTHVQEELDYLFSGANRNPFPRYQNFFNAHRVTVISNESGADQPPNGIFRDTALDASYWTGGIERCLYFDTGKANVAVNTALAGTGIDIDARLGLVNDSKYGGCGGQWAVYAAENSSAVDIGIHELGHSLGQLADEYFTAGTTYTGPEPNAVNLTKSPTTGKWDRWLGYNDPSTNIGPIGYFEGGGYYEFDIYRPSANSEMRSLFRPFDAVSREQFIRQFYLEVDPLDGWLGNSTPLNNPDTVWVDTVDPAVINVEWLLNGKSLGVLGESLDVATLALTPGDYVLEAFAYDAILDHSFSGDSLDWWRRSNTSLLEQSVSWNLTITPSGDFNGDGMFDCIDVDSLVFEIVNQTGAGDFDLNTDGVVDVSDLDEWLSIAGAAELPSGNPFLHGDANLDGVVDGLDFNAWNAHKFTAVAAWCSGDFSADGIVDGGDFIIWNANKFQSADALNAVPEPGGICLVALMAIAPRRRRVNEYLQVQS